MASKIGLAATATFTLLACSSTPPVTPRDAGIRDARSTDATILADIGNVDGGALDAGSDLDATVTDAGLVPPFTWPVPTSSIAITPSPSWKNSITRDDPFRNAATAPRVIRWVKFAVLMGDPSKVYFQDSARYPFHYEFATEVLDPFVGNSRAAFDAVSLNEAGQQVILGAVLFSPRDDVEEYGIQLVRKDAYHPEMVRIVFELVRASVQVSPSTEAFYFPTFEQSASARQHAVWLASEGVVVSSADRWAAGHTCYAAGWALGRLVRLDASEIDAAYGDGRLTYRDVLLTDSVPAEIPLVAGVLSLGASTPSSHVAILAGQYGIPFAHVAIDPERSALPGLIGKQVAVRANADFDGHCTLRVLDADRLEPALVAEILDLKAPPPIDLTAKQRRGAYSASTAGLRPTDVRHFGGKAANFGLLNAALPNASPTAIALSFDLWDDFLAQPHGNGTLRDAIATRLANHQWPPNVAALRADLLAIRTMIEDGTFTAQQTTALSTALAPFDAMKKIRFRSSTNVEDSDSFTGAGLYDSYSGCLADDTDADEVGPSHCDATRTKERGVDRAIRKVYASFYNDNAYLERLRHGVDESVVGMAVLVHHSYPDVDELANGVAVAQKTRWGIDIRLVSQAGAISVANPDGTARPEVVEVLSTGARQFYARLIDRSSAVPLGGYVMDWDADYIALAQLIEDVLTEFATYTGEDTFELDLEYKKVRGQGLAIKQLRRLLPLNNPANIVPVLLDAPTRLCAFQGEYGDVFANHRGKSRWVPTVQSTLLTEANLARTFFTGMQVDLLDGASVVMSSGAPTGHRRDGTSVIDTWEIGSRSAAMTIDLPSMVRALDGPFLTLADDLWATVTVTHPTPVPYLDWDGTPATRSDDIIRLGRCLQDNDITSDAALQERNLVLDRTRSILIRFYWPPAPTGIVAGYTAPLHQWVETTITGFTAQPIVLRGDYSQTYRPGHHNFSEDFIFEPRLEQGIDVAIIAELEAANIRLLLVQTGFQNPVVKALGTDGRFRTIAQ